jgi:hypothetical protein
MSLKGLGSDFAPDERDTGKSIDQLMHQDHYTASELAELLGLSLSEVEHAAHSGHLKAMIVDHHVISISRADALTWLADRG